MNTSASTADSDRMLEPDDRSVEPVANHAWILVLIVAVTLAATCWLVSAAQGTEAGHRPWGPRSVLRIVAETMAMQFQYPTRRGVEVKWLTQGLGAAVLLSAAAILWFAGTRRDEETRDSSAAMAPPGQVGLMKRPLPWVGVSQVALLILTGWALLSSLWASWPEAALGEGGRQVVLTIWALTLGRSLSRRGALQVACWLVGILAMTAAVGVWYYFERNPSQRLKFPIGNPIFLAACMLPGILLALCGTVWAWGHRRLSADEERHGTASSRLVPACRVWVVRIISPIALAVTFWAFYLAGSRGPLVGLAAGLFAALLILTIWSRSTRLCWLMSLLMLVSVMGCGYWLRSQFSVESGGRGATMRLRGYAWAYALDTWLDHPVAGVGQGGYFLRAQERSQADALQDPAAFSTASFFGHAHNEWLEILADLGTIGFLLTACWLLCTVAAGVQAIRRCSLQWDAQVWLGLGLLASLTAMFVEELSDVALRMPGFPLLFYTVVGLIWALARQDRSVRRPRRVLGWLRGGGLAGAVAVSLGVVGVVWRDWEGALAETRIGRMAAQQQWDEALSLAPVSTMRRLVIDDRVAAVWQLVRIGRDAAEHRLRTLNQMISRTDESRGLPPHIVRLAAQDVEKFEEYKQLCLSAGSYLLTRMPGCPLVAGWLADVWAFEAAMRQMGIVGTADPTSAVANSLEWRRREYQRDPQDAETALDLFRMAPNAPVAERIDWLRIPLRGGPPMALYEDDRFALDLLAPIERMLAELMGTPEYHEHMAQLVSHAQAAVEETDPVKWASAYAPETFRLWAREAKLRGDFEKAARLAAQAAAISRPFRERFPYLVNYALIDQARYALLAWPDRPQLALEVCTQAIDEWPDFGDREQRLVPLRRARLFYRAAVVEEEAEAVLRADLPSGLDEQQASEEIGSIYCELYETFVVFPNDRHPAKMEAWRQNCLALAEPDRVNQMYATSIRSALRLGDNRRALDDLTMLEERAGKSQRFKELLRALIAEFSSHREFMAWVQARLTAAPESRPATMPSH